MGKSAHLGVALAIGLLSVSVIPAQAGPFDKLWELQTCLKSTPELPPALQTLYANTQDILIAELERQGFIKPGFVLSNDLEGTQANVRILIDEKGNAAGLIVNLNKYSSDRARAKPRAFSLSQLREGFDLFKTGSRTSARMRAPDFKPESGGVIALAYLADLKQRRMGSVPLGLRKRHGAWEFYNPAPGTAVRKAKLVTWTSLLPPNLGIKRIDFE